MDKRVLEKYIEFFTTKIILLYKEQSFKYEKVQLKYILETVKDSNDLMIIFSGIPRKGIKARYNYMRSTQKLKINRLFILDDFGYDQRGNYYLGKNKKFDTSKAVINLISHVKVTINHSNENKTYYVGSSKGGWASLFFGVLEKESYIITGGPQYNLGNYLVSQEKDNNSMMKYIMGEDYQEDDVEFLNNLLKNVLTENSHNNSQIYLHYSENEPIYKNHVFDLLETLNLNQYSLFEDIESYNKHSEIALFFPQFIKDIFNKIERY